MNRIGGRCMATVILGLALCAGFAGRAAGDDTVVDELPGANGGPPGVAPWMGGMPAIDLGQQFDSQVFADAMGNVVVQGGFAASDQGPAAADEAAVVGRLEPARRRLAARIDRVDRIVGLSEQQRKKLVVAMESDLRRLADTITEARGRYVGRTVKMDPRNGGFDEASMKAMQQMQEDAVRCRQSLEAAAGPESLVAKVLLGTLDETQAKTYTAVMQARAACRWRAVVASGLAQIDDQAGFTQKQHDAVTELLLAEPPAAEDDSQGSEQAGMPTGMRVAQRLVALDGERLAAILDPRQRQAVAEVANGQMIQIGMPMMQMHMRNGMGMGGGFLQVAP
jgi:hypothetical protein